MPLHDWTRVDAERYHDFRNGWIIEIRSCLNGGLLPDDCEAVSESTISISQDDAGEGFQHRFPDVGTLRYDQPSYDPAGNGAFAEEHGSVVAVADAPPKVATEWTLRDIGALQKRILVRRGGGRLIAAIEIVSPSNLRTEKARQELAEKCRDLLFGGVHVCVFDPFPIGNRQPTVEEITIGDQVRDWQESRETTQGLAASYVSDGPGRMRKAYMEPLPIGAPLPTMPLFLTPSEYVNLPLEETYERAFAGVGRSVRRRLQSSVNDG